MLEGSPSPQGGVADSYAPAADCARFDHLPPDLYAQRVALDRKMIHGIPATVQAEVVAEFNAGDDAMLSPPERREDHGGAFETAAYELSRLV